MDSLISDTIELFDAPRFCRLSGRNVEKMEKRELIILEHLFEKTNIKKIFKKERLSYGNLKDGFPIFLRGVLGKLGTSRKKNSFSNLISFINEYLIERKRNSLIKKTYYVPLRIKFNISDIELKKLRTITKQKTGAEIVVLPKYISDQIKGPKLGNLFKGNRNLIRFKDFSRDSTIFSQLAEESVNVFLGAVVLSNHINKSMKKYIPSGDYSISKNILEKHCIVLQNKKIIHPSNGNNYEYEIKKEPVINKTFWVVNNKNYNTLISILNLLQKNNRNLNQLTREILPLYLEAITEKKLEISFLKFWIIIEKILKAGRGKNGRYIVDFIAKLMKDKYLRDFIPFLYQKRNNLVHEYNVDFITQSDRNLSKIIAERLIELLIDPPISIKNLEEFHILLDHILKTKNVLKTRRNVLSRIIRK